MSSDVVRNLKKRIFSSDKMGGFRWSCSVGQLSNRLVKPVLKGFLVRIHQQLRLPMEPIFGSLTRQAAREDDIVGFWLTNCFFPTFFFGNWAERFRESATGVDYERIQLFLREKMVPLMIFVRSRQVS
jgi:hypothetical protein